MCLIPGMSQHVRQIDMTEAEEQMFRMEAIYRSMAADEREYPDILNGSRRRRIADGAGVRTIEVNQFMKQFFMTRDMMHRVGGTGIRGKLNLMKSFRRGDRR